MSIIQDFLPSLNKAHIVYQDIEGILQALSVHSDVSVKALGVSFEGRPLKLVSLGNGPLTIFAWTQMHGDEPTATAAVFDWIDALLDQTPNIQGWEQHFTIHILPMVNPDGAQRRTRENAQAIDINRDAISLQSPEGQILMQTAKTLKPDVAFNLHDQSPYYQAGHTGHPATIAFLAPAYDIANSVNPSRALAMRLIACMHQTLQQDIPNKVARYDDSYSHRSFGDYIAGMNVSTILIESGAYPLDPNRQIARKMNLRAFVSAMKYLINRDNMGSEYSLDDYFAIPENREDACSSLLIKNLSFSGQHQYQAGVSIKQKRIHSRQFMVDYVGDLRTQAGLEEFDATGLSFKQGQIISIDTPITLTKQMYLDFLRRGVIGFTAPESLLDNQSGMDILLSQTLADNKLTLRIAQPAYFLMCKDEEVRAAVINGHVVNLLAHKA